MIVFNGSQEIKQKYLDRIKMHREIDHLVQGTGWESNGTTKGCAIGCTVEGYAHAVGMILLIGLIILVTFKDISQFFK